KCIDHYTNLRVRGAVSGIETNHGKEVDTRLEKIVNRMFQRCLNENQYRQALGLAIETKRMDIFESAILLSDDVSGMLKYAFHVAMNLIQNRGFRNSVLRSLINLYKSLGTPDYISMCQCLIYLDDAIAVAELLDRLSQETPDCSLMALQIGFDLYESGTQQFLGRVLQALRSTAPVPGALKINQNLKSIDIGGLRSPGMPELNEIEDRTVTSALGNGSQKTIESL
ncbi:hypothetical protein QAD02_021398, partial [Eretmocerus hayati]